MDLCTVQSGHTSSISDSFRISQRLFSLLDQSFLVNLFLLGIWVRRNTNLKKNIKHFVILTNFKTGNKHKHLTSRIFLWLPKDIHVEYAPSPPRTADSHTICNRLWPSITHSWSFSCNNSRG